MKVLVLGPIELDCDGDGRALAAQAQRLLGLFVARLGHETSVAQIAEELGLSSDAHTVRMAVSRLRRTLGGRIATNVMGYRLRLEAGDWLDVSVFEELVATSKAEATATGRLRRLREGLGLWRGAAFSGLDDIPAVRPVITRLEELRFTATEDLAETLLELDRPEEATLLLETVREAPCYRERPVALLMRAFAASGRVTEALRAYQRFRIELRDDIGVMPSKALRDLESQLLAESGRDGDGHAGAGSRPSGTVTFMQTEVEGSSRRWMSNPKGMADSLALHDRIVRAAVERAGGYVFSTAGDSFAVAFRRASEAVTAARSVHADLAAANWAGPALQVRIGLHLGEADERDGDYRGAPVNIAARVMAAGHGGQILLTDAVRATAHVTRSISACTGYRASTSPCACSSSAMTSSRRCVW